ncbi:MAG: transposase, partial [Candidatus Latescibacterota bacterium]
CRRLTMPSPPALLYDTHYHIYNRGTNREQLFREERNYQYFLKSYLKHIEPVAETFAYCLLRNHFHILVRVKSEAEIREITPVPSGKPARAPSQKFADFFNAYAKAINRAYRRTGSLFQHPFGRVPVTSDRQFGSVIAYIHQNPRKHKFVDDFRDWKWSSYGSLLSEQPTHLKRATVLDWFGGLQNYVQMHSQWITEAESRWFAADDDD